MPIVRIPITDREMWLQARQQYLGASELPVVLGEAGYGSAAELYAEKKGLRPPRVDSGVLRRGRWGEAAVFQALAEERPEWEITRAMVHVIDTDKRIACTPDGFAVTEHRPGIGIIQAKVISRSVFRDKWLDDPGDDIAYGDATPPAMYRIQTICERWLNRDRCPWAQLAVLINSEWDWTLRLFEVEPDPVIEQLIEDRAAAFYRDYLDPGIMPPFEPQRDEALIKALYPKDDGTEIDLTGDNRALALVDDLQETTAACKRLTAREKELKTELIGKLGTHTYGRLADGRRLSWKLQHRKGYAVEPTDFRMLRILKREDG